MAVPGQGCTHYRQRENDESVFANKRGRRRLRTVTFNAQGESFLPVLMHDRLEWNRAPVL